MTKIETFQNAFNETRFRIVWAQADGRKFRSLKCWKTWNAAYKAAVQSGRTA